MDYEAMLARGKEQLPDDIKKAERFTIPNIKGHIQGNKTIISNLNQIASTLGRGVEIIVKYVEKQLATKAQIEGTFVIFNTKLSAKKINDRVQQFTDLFVICKECGKPDTELLKEDRLMFIRCLACGAKHSVRGKI